MSYLDKHPEEVKNASYYRRQLKKAEAERDELRKWKEEAEKQEALYLVYDGSDVGDGWQQCCKEEYDATQPNFRKIAFPKPISSPDVAELQKIIAEMALQIDKARDELRKWKEEAEKREVVAWGLPNTAITGMSHALMRCELDIPSDDQYGGALWIPLYPKPIPSPDVAELQKRVAELEAELADSDCALRESRANDMESMRMLKELDLEKKDVEKVAAGYLMQLHELQRKLAEQQATLWKIGKWISDNHTTDQINEAVSILAESSAEELNTLLAQAREEGRKEACSNKPCCAASAAPKKGE